MCYSHAPLDFSTFADSRSNPPALSRIREALPWISEAGPAGRAEWRSVGGSKGSDPYNGHTGPLYGHRYPGEPEGYVPTLWAPGPKRRSDPEGVSPTGEKTKIADFCPFPLGPPLGAPWGPQAPPGPPGPQNPRFWPPGGPPGPPGPPARPLLRTRFFGVSPVHGLARKLFRGGPIFDPPPRGAPPRKIGHAGGA